MNRVSSITFLGLLLACGRLWAQDPATPIALPLLPQDRLLILSPHPDDDILGCAGVIQQALALKLPVQVVYLTSGDNYEWAFMAYKKRPVLLPAEMRRMGVVRQGEATAAEALLGVPAAQLHFLGYPDWGTEHIFIEHWGPDRPAFRSMLTKVTAVPYVGAFHPGAPYKGESVLLDLEKIISEFKPTKVFVSHPADAHRDHRTFYLFAQVALWDLEDQIRPLVYSYLIHHPHWPHPRGLQPGRTLHAPDLRGVQWTELKLSSGEEDQKRKALDLHRTQMVMDRNYLDSFVADNELFGGFEDIRLKSEVNPLPQEAAPLSDQAELEWRHIYREGSSIVFRMEFSTRSIVNLPVNMYAFGYRHNRPFVDMPKLRFLIRGRHIEVFDQARLMKNSGISLERNGRSLIVRVPVSLLGSPDRFIGTAWSRSAEEPFDSRVWRVVDLRPEGRP